MSESRRIEADYLLSCSGEEAIDLARRIAWEQTVELPESLVTDPAIRDRVVGRVESLREGPQGCRARISYAVELSNFELPQLLILLFGNVSLFPGVRLEEITLPPVLLGRLPGPRFGAEGLRRLCGVRGRPLLATAVKPRGLSIGEMAAMARDHALGGGDIIKDDQNLADDLAGFRERITAIAEAVAGANASTGRNCLYFPHVAAPAEALDDYLGVVAELGLKGVLMCPLVLGMEQTGAAARRHGLLLMAHPALSGSYTNHPAQGIAHGLLLGTLFRLAGADLSIFPGYGGRFSFTRQQCHAIRDALLRPLGGLAPALPAPAGGMSFDKLPALCRDYGEDAVFLIGGALQGHGPDLRTATAAFLDRIRESFGEEVSVPEEPFASACELPGAGGGAIRTLLRFREGFLWEGREPMRYKTGESLPFRGVKRVELTGQQGEPVAFDLRYFELASGGYTSLERHRHCHVIIGARGEGLLVLGGRQEPLRPMDVAYVKPWQVHQLRNPGREPFGFFCIVDHQRDRPRPP